MKTEKFGFLKNNLHLYLPIKEDVTKADIDNMAQEYFVLNALTPNLNYIPKGTKFFYNPTPANPHCWISECGKFKFDYKQFETMYLENITENSIYENVLWDNLTGLIYNPVYDVGCECLISDSFDGSNIKFKSNITKYFFEQRPTARPNYIGPCSLKTASKLISQNLDRDYKIIVSYKFVEDEVCFAIVKLKGEDADCFEGSKSPSWFLGNVKDK